MNFLSVRWEMFHVKHRGVWRGKMLFPGQNRWIPPAKAAKKDRFRAVPRAPAAHFRQQAAARREA
jgi:hypothetical protein